MHSGPQHFLATLSWKSCFSISVLMILLVSPAAYAFDVRMVNEGSFSGENSATQFDQEGYDLLNLIVSRAGMGLVSSFEDLNRTNNGLVILLGNRRSPLPWNELENWVRRGGVLLVAFDEAPPRPLQTRMERLTGFQWSNLRLKHMGEKGVDLLPQRSFAEIQKLVPFDWSMLGKGETPPVGAKSTGMGHTNSPSFLLSMDGAASKGTVFARLPVAVELDLAPGMSMRLPAFRADFGVVANVGRGKVIQLADPDVFSNQMLELEGNFQFSWAVLQSVKKDKTVAPEDFPVMIVGQRVETEVYTLPVPPIPLPELDIFQMASLATRALAEKLPNLENPGGPFDRLSNRLALGMSRTFWMGLGAGVLAFLGFLVFSNQRGAYRAKRLATQTSEEAIAKSREKTKASVIHWDASQKVLYRWINTQSTREIPLWELGQLFQGWISNERVGGTPNPNDKIQKTSAWRLMNWIARGGSAKPEKVGKAMEVVAKRVASHPSRFSSPISLNS